MRAEEGDESIRDYAHEARETRAHVDRRSWPTRLRHALSALMRRR
ncbi:hypothetical protein [Mycolicibacter longobardus]|nr:hypothetical protein [Mycolicibacter longobardus]